MHIRNETKASPLSQLTMACFAFLMQSQIRKGYLDGRSNKMKSSELSGESHVPRELVKFGTYEWPRSEARQTLGHLFEKLKTAFVTDSKANAVDDEHLKTITDATLKNSVCDRLTTILGTQLDQAFLEWTNTAANSLQRRAFIYPPMKEDVLSDWAGQHGLPILDRKNTLENLADASCVVIPNLETFFSRDYTQLAPLFDLFHSLTRFEGKVIVGCNSWAWMFMKQFDDARLLFGEALTVPAFDADALAEILEGARSTTRDHECFKSVESGERVFARDKDGALNDPYLEKLASYSLGIPWVAVDIFFKGITETNDPENDSDDDCIWVELPSASSLPVSGSEPLLFALQALVIHGARPLDELSKLIPHRVPSGVWTELERAGFIEIQDGYVHCKIGSYPDIRSELGAAGFNLDEL